MAMGRTGASIHDNAKVKQIFYLVRELDGLIFAYMGPQPDDRHAVNSHFVCICCLSAPAL